eukprot:167166_1
MVKYSATAENPEKTCKTRASNLRVHYKNTREAAHVLKGMKLKRAQRYLNEVIGHKDIVPFKVHTGGIGRHAQTKKWKCSQGRWPEKSCRFLLNILQNLESNAESQGLEVEQLTISHVQVNRAPKQRRRTYRAHGRINPYMSNTCHVEMMASEPIAEVNKGTAEKKRRQPRSNRRLLIQVSTA